jgi:hypothetical protein
MPVRKVIKGGRVGYQWGQTGKIYTGPKARQKAALQGAAVQKSQAKKGKTKKY